MSHVIVLGCQWGDEGKGKIVDWLSLQADGIIRFQGGHNAGHTLVIDATVFKLSLLPSGIVRKGKKSFIGNGVVIDPWALLKEIDILQKQGVIINSNNLFIAENSSLILPIHKQLDINREKLAKNQAIGTTKRGIGPSYEDKIRRRSLRFGDLAFPSYCKKIIDDIFDFHYPMFESSKSNMPSSKEVYDNLMNIAPILVPFSTPVWKELYQLNKDNKKLLFEGAQGLWLDIDHGTYPYVTSSSTCTGQAFCGSGLTVPAYVLGIVKAYTTRVGSGPFPTEQLNDIGDKLGKLGHEFGTVTGRKRRCGWLDAVMLRQGIRIAGVNGIVLTKLDVLDTFSELKIAVKYNIFGKDYDWCPSIPEMQKDIKITYETLPGWLSSTQGIQNMNELPMNAIRYIRRIEELLGIPITLISTSPKREDTITIMNPFFQNV